MLYDTHPLLNNTERISLTLLPPDLAAFLDRSNIGNAKTAGMDTDLGISDGQYQVRALVGHMYVGSRRVY